MSATLTTEQTTDVQTTTTLTVRVPRGNTDGLTAGVKTQLNHIDNVTAATITTLDGIEPRGTATYATVEASLTVTVETEGESKTAIQECLSESVSVDSIDHISIR